MLDNGVMVVMAALLLSPILLLTVALLIDRHRLRRAQRLDGGHCQSCGYDLTGNVSGVCPECGVRIER